MVAHLKSNSFYLFISFGIFVITLSIIQLANYKNIHFYYIFNLLIRLFSLSKETTKQYENLPLYLEADILFVCYIIFFHSCSELIFI